MTALATAALAIALGGGASSAPDPAGDCDTALANAMAVDPGSDTVMAFDSAMASCTALRAWLAAALDDRDAAAESAAP